MEVLIGYLAERPMPPRDRLWALRQGLGSLCDSRDDGVHPSGTVRIGALSRRHPGVSAALGCAPPPRGACTLRGRRPILAPLEQRGSLPD